MRIIGLNFTKILAEKSPDFKLAEINTNIEFEDIAKEDVGLPKEDSESLKITFKFSVNYSDKEKKDSKKGEVVFQGNILLLASKEESKELLKSWKKKELPDQFRISLFNFLLQKCSLRALQLEEEIGLPLHFPLPQLRPGQQPQDTGENKKK